MCVSIGPLWDGETNPYRAGEAEQNRAREREEGRQEKRRKQLGSIEGKLMAHLILSALLLCKALEREGNLLK